MAAIDNYNLAENTEFRNKVDSLIRKSSIAIAGEEPTEALPIAAVNKRAALCNRIFYDNNRSVEYMFSKACAAGGTLTENSPDNDIEFTINAIFSDMAGVTYTDLQPVIE